MPAFNPAVPVHGAVITSDELRDNFNALKGLIDAIPSPQNGVTLRYVSALGGVYTGLNCGDLLVLDIAVQIVLPSGAYSPGFYFDILSICGDFSGLAGITRDIGGIIDDTISPTTGPLWGGNPVYYPNRRFCQCRVHFLGDVDYSSQPVWLLTNNTHFSTSAGGF